MFYDSETTGMVLWGKPSDIPEQPHMVQLGALLCDQDGNDLESMNRIIRPDGWVIPEEATKIHGITHERAMDEGIPEEEALIEFLGLAGKAQRRIAHNDNFDARIIRIACLRYGRREYAENGWQSMDRFCTMKSATNHCRILHQNPRHSTDYKWPKLAECIRVFFGEELEGAHDAMIDLQACKRVYFHLLTL